MAGTAIHPGEHRAEELELARNRGRRSAQSSLLALS